jgi:hypothetical protein
VTNPKYSLAWYNRACVYSLIDDKEQSMSDLRHAIEINPTYKEMARADNKFEHLRDNEEFKKLLNITE